MPEQRRRFSAQFKAEAVQMVLETGKPIAEVARDLGIHDGTLGNWVNTWRREHPEPQGHCVLGLLLVTAVIRSCGRRLARRVARAMLVSPLARWNPIAVLRRVAMTAGPLPVRA